MTNDSSPIREKLNQLIGTWDVKLVFPTDPPGTIQAQATFDWIEDGAFVVERLGNSVWMMGADETSESYSILYHDDRGVSRVYQMSLADGLWKMWRNAPGFSQRFEGRFSDDGKSITAHWEINTDDSNWEHDFDLFYTRVGQPS